MIKSSAIIRGILAIASAGALTASVLAGTITINDTTAGTTQTCTYNSLSVDASGNASTTISGCSSGGSTSGTSTSGTSTSGTSTSGTSTSGTSTSGTSTSGTSTSGTSGDPGWLSGTWMPEGSAGNFWVVDQSSAQAAGATTYIPGCVNQTTTSPNCPYSYSFLQNNVLNTITLNQNNRLSVRYRTLDTIGTTQQYFYLTDGTGQGIPANVVYTLSTTPGNFDNVAAACKKTASAGSQPKIFVVGGASNCTVTPNTTYYLNVMTTSPCTGATCRFIINEPSALAK
ncbi:MAG: hypothetical protein JNM37_14060 [Rhodocyclaceae bacterium]|nr:hypothetical protein [Rhodocyclaceae bacterium]